MEAFFTNECYYTAVLLIFFCYVSFHGILTTLKDDFQDTPTETSIKSMFWYSNSTVLSRAFEPHSFPCILEPEEDMINFPFQNSADATYGLLYQKTPKCASTTSSGVNLRIARNVARRRTTDSAGNNNNDNQNSSTMCDNRWAHGKTDSKFATRFRNRKREQSFLWTLIREPTARYVSHYFFGPIRSQKTEPSLESFKAWLSNEFSTKSSEEKVHQNVYHCYLATQRNTSCGEVPEAQMAKELNEIMLEYNFIGITERYDESLVVLMMLLQLSLADIIYFSSKTSGGGYATGRGKPPTCMRIPPKTLPEDDGFQDYFESDEWQERIKWDQQLHQAANRSLDLTIDQLGRNKVEEYVVRFHVAQQLVSEQCDARVKMPCDDAVTLQRSEDETDCLVKDIGCGMDCLDEVANELQLW